MVPDGRSEQVQPQIGLYFTPEAPTNTLYKFALTSLIVDIPAGATNYLVRDSFRLPVDVDLLAVLPHTHYLGRRLEGTDILPDGSRQSLLLIKEWDFNWQGDYHYAKPVALPKGTVLEMNYSFDNSTNNIRNPSHPPKRVRWGSQSSDEMAELWFQVLPQNNADRNALEQSNQQHAARYFMDSARHDLQEKPQDPDANIAIGRVYMNIGQNSEAEKYFRAAIGFHDPSGEAHYFLGMTLQIQNRLSEARIEFEATLKFKMNPNQSRAHVFLGYMDAGHGDLVRAESHFRNALSLDPDDEIARQALDRVIQMKTPTTTRP